MFSSLRLVTRQPVALAPAAAVGGAAAVLSRSQRTELLRSAEDLVPDHLRSGEERLPLVLITAVDLRNHGRVMEEPPEYRLTVSGVLQREDDVRVPDVVHLHGGDDVFPWPSRLQIEELPVPVDRHLDLLIRRFETVIGVPELPGNAIKVERVDRRVDLVIAHDRLG